jgi:hypothetical protein
VYKIDQSLKPAIQYSRFVPEPERGHGLVAGNRRSDPHDRSASLYFMYSRFGPNSPEFGLFFAVHNQEAGLTSESRSSRTDENLDSEDTKRSDLSGVWFFPVAYFQEETNMKKLITVLFAFSLLLCGVTVAQDNMKADKSAKAVKITGKIGDDGKTFVNDKDSKSWTISNPEAVKGHEGHHVTLTAHVYTDKNEVHVMSLKMVADKMKKDSKY